MTQTTLSTTTKAIQNVSPSSKPDKRAKKWISGINSILLPGGVLLATILIWEMAVRIFNIPSYVLPAPSNILVLMIEKSELLLRHSVPTTVNILLGFFLAVLVTMVLAPIMVYSKSMHRVIYPLLVMSQVVPKVALAPLFIIWVGFGSMSKILMAFLIAFFPILIDTLGGLSSVQAGSVSLFRSMGASKWQEFWTLRLPHSIPQLFAGLKVGITFATVGEIVGEFVGADEGLGYVLTNARGMLDTEMVFAAIMYLVIIGTIMYLLVELLEIYLMRNRRRSH